jgi:YfiH family protein
MNKTNPILAQTSNIYFPKNVRLFSTLRSFPNLNKTYTGKNNYADFNLATHVGDDLNLVKRNREALVKYYNLPNMPKWLEQTHSNICLQADNSQCFGDAIVTKNSGVVCAILTADCLPIFASNIQGTQVGVAHAGWRGIVNGVIESFISKFNQQQLIVHFGAAISQTNFAVGQDVFDEFIAKDVDLKLAFIPFKDKYKLDIYQATRIILNKLGVKNISGGDKCTFTQVDDYFSYRRDGVQSGRMAHLIWID